MPERTPDHSYRFDLPEGVTMEHLEYLDDLRESGETNMFAATPYLEAEFDLDRVEAKRVLVFWMDTFSERHQPGPPCPVF